MDRNLYLEIRRLANIVRQDTASSSRLIFDELSIMCTLYGGKVLTVSDLAASQEISCPTMTHRGNHLDRLGLLVREGDQTDRRRLNCSLSEKGAAVLQEILDFMLDNLADTRDHAHVTQEELVARIASMGRLPMTADSLVLFCFAMRGAQSMSIKALVRSTAMLQPTVSMAVLRLEYDGYIERHDLAAPDARRPTRRLSGCVITPSGTRFGKEIVRLVEEL